MLTYRVNNFDLVDYNGYTVWIKKLQQLCNDKRKLVREHGADRARRIGRRLDDLRAAPCLEDMKNLPGRLHELLHNRSRQLSLDLDHPYRLILEPDHNPIPEKPDGGMDWSEITAIIIIGIEDTHE